MQAEEQKRKKLRLLVLTDFTPYGDAAVCHAAALSLVFQAELIIVPLINMDTLPTYGTFSNAIGVLEEHQLPVVYHGQQLYPKKELYPFMEEHEIMMLVMAASAKKESFFSFRSASRLVKKMRVPVLVVGKSLPKENAYRNILLPLDSSVYAKEKSLWASYFNRFYKSEIHILSKKYKDEYLQNKSYENLEYTKKLYENLSVAYTVEIMKGNTSNLDYYALSVAKKINASLIISITTKYREIGDFLFGTKENKTIRYVNEIPYLYINQRDDLYVLCT